MAAEALEQSVLESKDKDQLLAIAKALGLKASARTKKADIITLILDTTNSGTSAPAISVGARRRSHRRAPQRRLGDHRRRVAPPAVGTAVDDSQPHPRGQHRASPPTTQPSATESADSTSPLPLDDEPPADWELELAESDVDGCHRARLPTTTTAVDGEPRPTVTGGHAGGDRADDERASEQRPASRQADSQQGGAPAGTAASRPDSRRPVSR